jgi:uncharacterized protein YprB with RNaseH-like and TPR domain
VLESIGRLAEYDVEYFARSLPSSQHWRLFPEFRDSVLFLDIETTGMAPPDNAITTIATYDGISISYYIKEYNLHQFKYDVEKYRMLVTYNGRCFDVPVIERYFRVKMPQAHIDLRFLLKGLGFTGGLKGCEKKLGIDRRELDGVDGFLAVLLWHEFKNNHNFKALETLLAYNILDAVNLEQLMVMAYNLKLQQTPFSETHRLPVPTPAENLFEPDAATVKKVMDLRDAHWY